LTLLDIVECNTFCIWGCATWHVWFECCLWLMSVGGQWINWNLRNHLAFKLHITRKVNLEKIIIVCFC